MVLFNYSTKEITAKIVYYGPGLCGKTTNLQFIYDSLPSNSKSRMLSLATKADRTLFFDFLPIDLGKIRGMKTRVQLYTVPGQVYYNSTRQLVLKGADGVVFVADSQASMLDANKESWNNLKDNLKKQGIKAAEMPIVIQCNKRDLPKVLSLEDLDAGLNEFNSPIFEAVATTGIGVEDTLKGVSKLVLKQLIARYGVGTAEPFEEEIRIGAITEGAEEGELWDDSPRAMRPPAAAPPPPVSTPGRAAAAVAAGGARPAPAAVTRFGDFDLAAASEASLPMAEVELLDDEAAESPFDADAEFALFGEPPPKRLDPERQPLPAAAESIFMEESVAEAILPARLSDEEVFQFQRPQGVFDNPASESDLAIPSAVAAEVVEAGDPFGDEPGRGIPSIPDDAANAAADPVEAAGGPMPDPGGNPFDASPPPAASALPSLSAGGSLEPLFPDAAPVAGGRTPLSRRITVPIPLSRKDLEGASEIRLELHLDLTLLD